MAFDFESSRLGEKERFFREFSVWPTHSELNTEDWLSNFNPNERPIAERLLTNFCYFNERMTDALLRSALTKYFVFSDQINAGAAKPLENYITETAFIICEGENPNPTDSGHIFARKLRDRCGIPESQIFWPRGALEKIESFKRFVFVDDFTGSGNQFINTWKAIHLIDGTTHSFESAPGRDERSFSYCCCIAASRAKERIALQAPSVQLFPAHQLTERHNTTSPESSVWENNKANRAIPLIKQASVRAGYCAENFGQDDWRGFHGLGLALAFNHGIPDASLPIFFSRRNGWKPLISRARP